MTRIMRLFPTHLTPELGQLRGGPFFQFLKDEGIEIREMEKDGGIALGAGIMFVDGGQVGCKSVIDSMRNRLGERVKVIVDVHFPLTMPELVTAFQPGTTDDTRDRDLDRRAQEYWADPLNRHVAVEMVEEADAVTCPNRWWARGLEKYNANVFVLPDTVDPRTGAEFAVGWARACMSMGLHPYSWLRLWLMKFSFRSVFKDQWDKEKGAWRK